MWDNYVTVSELSEQRSAYQVASFLTIIGPDALDIYNGLDLTEKEKDVAKII